MKKSFMLLALLVASVSAQAAVYEVNAKTNSTTGGSGVAVAAFTVGTTFTITTDPLDLWKTGNSPHWSNANGLTGPNLLSTGFADTNGDRPTNKNKAGTIIGQSYANRTQGGLSAPQGALVGEWGNALGQYFLIGTNFTGIALDSQLKLYAFDRNISGNGGSILANLNISAVPEPETYGMLLAGLGLISFSAKRRKTYLA